MPILSFSVDIDIFEFLAVTKLAIKMRLGGAKLASDNTGKAEVVRFDVEVRFTANAQKAIIKSHH